MSNFLNKMIFLTNIKIMNKFNIIFLFNIVSLIFSTWISHRSNDVSIHNTYLNMKYNKGNTGNVRNNRLLTNDVSQSEIGQSESTHNLTMLVEKNTLKDISGSTDIYEKINKDTSNSMHAYIKKLEHGYHNKKGLKRLDCHYEKKLFHEMYKLDTIAGHMKSKNSYFKKVIWKRYGLRFVIFSLVVLFGIVTSIWCHMGGIDKEEIKFLINNPSDPSPQKGLCSVCKVIDNVILGSNGIIYFPLVIAFLSFILYITSKVRKYKRLKKRYGNIREV